MDFSRDRSIRAFRHLPALGLAAQLSVASIFLLGGCSAFDAPRDTRGARLDSELVGEITPGVQTRRDVLALLGTPTVTPAFDDLTWYYVGGITRQRVMRRQALDEQDVVAVHFNLEGTVQKVEQLTLADAQAVTPVSRTTPSPGTERSIMQELFGNIGRFSPGQNRSSGN
jgi:outer membrane protein assembly factor BamE (lipoprotein component of BamABCDE complex)